MASPASTESAEDPWPGPFDAGWMDTLIRLSRCVSQRQLCFAAGSLQWYKDIIATHGGTEDVVVLVRVRDRGHEVVRITTAGEALAKGIPYHALNMVKFVQDPADPDRPTIVPLVGIPLSPQMLKNYCPHLPSRPEWANAVIISTSARVAMAKQLPSDMKPLWRSP